MAEIAGMDTPICGIYYDGMQIFKKLNIEEINGDPVYQMIGSPVESGVLAIDNIVRMPTTVIVRGTYIDDDWGELWSDYEKILSTMSDPSKFCEVADGSWAWAGLKLLKFPTKKSNSRFDAHDITLEFQELMTSDEDTWGGVGDDSGTKNVGIT